MAVGRRKRRMGALIQAELGDILLRRVKDPRLKMISITAVDVSPDMKQAKVFYSLLGDENRTEVEKAFQAAAGFIRSQLAKSMQSKITPRLVLVYDDSLRAGAEMTSYIKEVINQDGRVKASEPDDEDQA